MLSFRRSSYLVLLQLVVFRIPTTPELAALYIATVIFDISASTAESSRLALQPSW